MTIAYMGSQPWNDDVMIEVGFRIASGLPLVVICDAPVRDQAFKLPMIISDLNHVQIPPTGVDDTPDRVGAKVEELFDLIQAAEQQASRIESHHPIAVVHYHKSRGESQVDADEMHYIAASDMATDLFGIKQDDSDEYRLVGSTMREFLDSLRFRMPPQHYEVFRSSQQSARSSLSDRIRTNIQIPPAVDVPIVLNRHPNPAYVGRAFLPVIVSKFVSDDKAWCNLKVLYLEVTSGTDGKTPQPPPPAPPGSDATDPRYWVCSLANGSRIQFEAPERKPIGVFLSYNSADHDLVEQFRSRLVHLSPAIEPWLDREQIEGADDITRKLTVGIPLSEFAIVFLGKNGAGPFQKDEVNLLMDLRRSKGLKVFLVLLDGVGLEALPTEWIFLKSARAEKYEVANSDGYLSCMFDAHFGDRFYY